MELDATEGELMRGIAGRPLNFFWEREHARREGAPRAFWVRRDGRSRATLQAAPVGLREHRPEGLCFVLATFQAAEREASRSGTPNGCSRFALGTLQAAEREASRSGIPNGCSRFALGILQAAEREASRSGIPNGCWCFALGILQGAEREGSRTGPPAPRRQRTGERRFYERTRRGSNSEGSLTELNFV